MKYGYARVSADGQTVGARVFREVVSGAKSDRRTLHCALDQLAASDVLMVTRLDRLARSPRNLLNTLAAITDRKAGFRSLGDTWADTATSRVRLTLGGLADDAERVATRASVDKSILAAQLKWRKEAFIKPPEVGQDTAKPQFFCQSKRKLCNGRKGVTRATRASRGRSEEHTSEL